MKNKAILIITGAILLLGLHHVDKIRAVSKAIAENDRKWELKIKTAEINAWKKAEKQTIEMMERAAQNEKEARKVFQKNYNSCEEFVDDLFLTNPIFEI